MPTRTDIAVPIGQRTDRLPDQQTHRPPKDQAICKSPIPPQPAKAPHAPGASLSDRSPAPAPARARARFLRRSSEYDDNRKIVAALVSRVSLQSYTSYDQFPTWLGFATLLRTSGRPNQRPWLNAP